MLKRYGKKRFVTGIVPLLGLFGIVLAGTPPLAAQTVEERLAALEARIRQLEGELAAARATPTEAVVGVGVNRSDSAVSGAFIRPAVLTTQDTVELASAAVPAAVAAPPQQEQDFTGDFEGLNFFKTATFSGFLDAYYLFNFNEPPDRDVGFRNFDFHHNSFTLNLAELSMAKAATEGSPIGYNLTYGLGPTADFVNGADYGEGTTADNFFQYFLSTRLPTSRGITLDFGKFVTIAGAEVIETAPNWNYSRGLLFGLAIPFHHFGFRATVPVADTLTLTGLVVNGWDNVLDSNGGKTYGVMFNWAPSSRFSFIQNVLTGPETEGDNDTFRHLFDSVLTVKLHDKVTFMTNFDYGMDRSSGDHVHWIGTANYLKLQLSDSFSLTPRFEFFSDPMGFRTGARQQLKEFTITPEILVNEHMITRFEFRRDWSNIDAFSVNEPDDDPSVQNTASVGMIVKF